MSKIKITKNYKHKEQPEKNNKSSEGYLMTLLTFGVYNYNM